MLTWMRRMGTKLGAIALIALFMRAVLPAGYMLAEADTGGARYVTLQICDGHASAQKLLNLDTGEEVLLSALPLSLRCLLRDWPVGVVAPALIFVRALALGVGLATGLVAACRGGVLAARPVDAA